jgi:hypothetical protein
MGGIKMWRDKDGFIRLQIYVQIGNEDIECDAVVRDTGQNLYYMCQ